MAVKKCRCIIDDETNDEIQTTLADFELAILYVEDELKMKNNKEIKHIRMAFNEISDRIVKIIDRC